VGPERGPLSLLSTTGVLFERKSSVSDLENRDYGRRGSAALSMRPPLSEKVCTNFSVGIVRSRTQATEIFCVFVELRATAVNRMSTNYAQIMASWSGASGFESRQIILRLQVSSLNWGSVRLVRVNAGLYSPKRTI
jgi:hypothetical protein